VENEYTLPITPTEYDDIFNEILVISLLAGLRRQETQSLQRNRAALSTV